MGINGNNGAGGIGRNSSLTGLFKKVTSGAQAPQTTAPNSLGSAFDAFHKVDGFFSAPNSGVGEALARASDRAIPIHDALPALSKYLGNASRFNTAA